MNHDGFNGYVPSLAFSAYPPELMNKRPKHLAEANVFTNMRERFELKTPRAQHRAFVAGDRVREKGCSLVVGVLDREASYYKRYKVWWIRNGKGAFFTLPEQVLVLA